MKPKSALYFGMTNSQLGILAGAAVLALLVIGGLSWFFFSCRRQNNRRQQLPQKYPQRPAPVFR